MNRLAMFVIAGCFLAATPVYGRVGSVFVEQLVRHADIVCICKVEKVEQDTNTVTASLVRSLKGTPELIIVIQGRVYDCKPTPLSAVMKPGERYLVFKGKQNVPRVYVLKIDKDHLVHLGPYTRGFTGVTVGEAGDPFLPINEAVKQIKTILAAQNKPTKIAAERAKALKDNLKSFQLQLRYHGPQRKPYYVLTLSVLPVPQLASDRFNPIVQIKEDQAARIIDFLVKDGFFDQATDPRADKTRPPTTSGYTLSVNGKDVAWHAELGWNLAMLARLDGFHAVLDSEAKKAMGLLIGRLSGHRREWEKLSADNPINPMKLLAGYKQERLESDDTDYGRIFKKGGADFEYDIGPGAFNPNDFASPQGEVRWSRTQVTATEKKVYVELRKDGFLSVFFPESITRFSGRVRGPEDIADILLMVMTF